MQETETDFDLVKKIVVENLGLKKDRIYSIKTDTKIIEDLGADSLDMVEITIELEEAFDIEIKDDEILDMNTFQDILTIIEKKK